uniref:REM-1 domain-containing protein n=1 Tax=Strigops habroptila TaxID=2489341 RepID=A0A672UDQ1_STRHB
MYISFKTNIILPGFSCQILWSWCGCNPLAETGRSKLQNQRAVLNQQILRAVRMRAGAENLLRATTNNKVREQVLLELSFVNSDLQILKEELEGLNISVEVYQNSESSVYPWKQNCF